MATRGVCCVIMNPGRAIFLVVLIRSVASSALERNNGILLRRQLSSSGNSRQRGMNQSWPTLADFDLSQQKSIAYGGATYTTGGDGVGPVAGLIEEESASHPQNSRQHQRNGPTGWHNSPPLIHGRTPPHSVWTQKTLSVHRDQPTMISMVSEQAVAKPESASSSEVPQTSRGGTAGGISESLRPWLVPKDVRVQRSELTKGQQDMIFLAKKLSSGEMSGERLQYERRSRSRRVAEWFAKKLGVTQGDVFKESISSAFSQMFPKGTVYNARDEDEEFRRVAVGAALGVGASGVVSSVQDVTDALAAKDFAAKFFYEVVRSDSARHIERGNTRLDRSLSREVTAREKVLSKASKGDLLRNGVAVAHGLYTLDSKSPGPVSLNLPLLFRPQPPTSTSPFVLFSHIIMVMPLLGPALERFWSKAYTASALKYIVYSLVKSVAYLNHLGIVHSDIKPNNTAVDPETGELFVVDLEFVQEAGKDQKCEHYLTFQFASPERARCYLEDEKIFQLSEWVDSWALGVSLVMILCDNKHPYGLFPKLETEEESERCHILFSWILNRSKRKNFIGRSCRFLDETRAALLEIAMLLLDPQQSTRWTAQKLVKEHPFFQVVED